MGLGWVCAIIAFVLIHSHLFPVGVYSAARNKVYIVHMKPLQLRALPALYNTQHEWYSDHFQSLTSAPADSIIYSYENAFHGFAAVMSSEQAESLRQSEFVLAADEDTLYNLHTTRTPQFLGLNNQNLWSRRTLDELNEASQKVIIGMLDTAVWPESESFGDDGMDDVPSGWRGACEFGDDDFRPKSKIYCNKKLIGARVFTKGGNHTSGERKEFSSPRDYNGHGTHTASTAAGSPVTNASLFGLAQGTAQGMACRARLAVYKVCGHRECAASDIIAAVDRAILDRVDVLSLSIGGIPGTAYTNDVIAIATFAAMENGIFVSCSAGNSGPDEASVVNVAPWLMTVGAGTIDRDFPAFVTLGNGQKYNGLSFYGGKGMGSNLVELVYAGGNSNYSNFCLNGSLEHKIVSGKVVLCDSGIVGNVYGRINGRLEKDEVVRQAGGVGMILANTEEYGREVVVADIHLFPMLAVTSRVSGLIREYAMWTKNPKALLTFGGTEVNVKPSPVVAAFSSRGPNPVTVQILKPDITAPGVNILAGWSGAVAPTHLPTDPTRTDFNFLTGTSMSAPHVSGLAALLKAAHPKWSPSAIKSALMTTAYTADNTNSSLHDAADNTTSTPWAHGAGHVNIHKALSPGLVYDATTDDYIGFLCSINYTIGRIQFMTRRSNISCMGKFRDPGQLNYPSFSVVF
ncbi:hypothetical protein OROHE_012361 [Orobanche hederae]